MNNYYNEIDLYAAQWLRNLIAAGHIAPGDVDTRSIEDVKPDDLRSYTQCHFFAGIGVWSHSLRAAGWEDARPVWTGSCPCQPFSAAGKGAGFGDSRHLWPVWKRLIEERGPSIVLGEQVASKDADPWIDLVCADLEGMDYAFGAVPFPASLAGAYHIRERTYWVAYANGREQGDRYIQHGREYRQFSEDSRAVVGGDVLWIRCSDGVERPIEPGALPLAHGLADRLAKIRAYGNALDAKAAHVWIDCVMKLDDVRNLSTPAAKPTEEQGS